MVRFTFQNSESSLEVLNALNAFVATKFLILKITAENLPWHLTPKALENTITLLDNCENKMTKTVGSIEYRTLSTY